MSDTTLPEPPRAQADFIDTVRASGSHQEACDLLQKVWDERCALTERLAVVELQRDRAKGKKPYPLHWVDGSYTLDFSEGTDEPKDEITLGFSEGFSRCGQFFYEVDQSSDEVEGDDLGPGQVWGAHGLGRSLGRFESQALAKAACEADYLARWTPTPAEPVVWESLDTTFTDSVWDESEETP